MSSDAVEIGEDVADVHGEALALINGVEHHAPAFEGEYPFPMTISGYLFNVQIQGPHSHRCIIHMGDGERL
jgi:hypothetical protein